MKLVAKTVEKIVLEVTSAEISKSGFDSIWDKVREVYPTQKFEIFSISTSDKNPDIIFIELSPSE